MKKNRWTTSNKAVFNVGYHLIWCPKYRRKVLTDEIEQKLKILLVKKAEEISVIIEQMEVMPDHVHIFVQADPQMAPVEIAKTLKSISAVHLFHKFPKLKNRKFWGEK